MDILITTSIRLALALVAVVIVINLGATHAVLRNGDDSAAWKASQICVVWLLPLVGAFVVAMLRDTWRAGPGAANASARFGAQSTNHPQGSVT